MKLSLPGSMSKERYLSFEPWHGGFNNVRTSLEIAYALAYMSGRTLVLPPAYQVNNHTRPTHLTEFFDISGIPTCGFETFRERWPQLQSSKAHERITFAPISEQVARQWDGIETVAVTPVNDPLHTVYCFPKKPRRSAYFERFLCGRTPVKRLGVPDSSRVVHFPQTLLGPFYAMIYCPDPGELTLAVHQGVKYHDWIFAAARAVVDQLGQYSALHVRRRDFAYFSPEQMVSGEQMLASIENIIEPGERIYVATDDPDSTEFEPLAKRHKLCFAGDYLNLLPPEGRSAEFLPLIEQIICTHGRRFVGTQLSTLSSYIYRLRGHLGMADTNYYVTSRTNVPGSQAQNEPGWHGVVGAGDQWTRDFPEAWAHRGGEDPTDNDSFVPGTILCQEPGWSLEERGQGFVLRKLDTGDILQCNVTAAMIWKLCNGNRRLDECIGLLQSGYHDTGDISQKIKQIAKQLSDHGALSQLRQKAQPIESLLCYEAPGEKIRLGRDHDGGYVLVDGFDYDVMISCGIGGDDSFEIDFLRKHDDIECFAFDCDATDNEGAYAGPRSHPRIHFTQACIGPDDGPGVTNLHQMIENFRDIFLKMDIEGAELEWISGLTRNQLEKFKQIVIEFHSLRHLWQSATEWKCLRKLSETHYLVHLHGNNCCGTEKVNGVDIPVVFEATYLRRSDLGIELRLNKETIPGRLDMRNVLTNDEISLSGYPFTVA